MSDDLNLVPNKPGIVSQLLGTPSYLEWWLKNKIANMDQRGIAYAMIEGANKRPPKGWTEADIV